MTAGAATAVVTNGAELQHVNDSPAEIQEIRHNRIFGKYRHPKFLSIPEKVFLGVSPLGLLVSMGFNIHRLATLPKDSDDYTFAIMLFFTTLVSFYYVISGVLKERWPELVVFIVSCLILVCYLAVNLAYASPFRGKTEKMVRLSVGGAFFVFILLLGGWLVWNYFDRSRMVCLINCQEGMVKKLRWLFSCASLITLDWQLQTTALICVLEHGTAATGLEIGLIVGGALVSSLRLVAGYKSIYNESKVWMSGFFLLWLLNLAYMTYKGWRLAHLAPIEEGTALYHASIGCIAVTLVLGLILFATFVKVARNFGKGVKGTLKYDDPAELHPPKQEENGHEMDVAGDVTEGDHHLYGNINLTIQA